MKLYRINNVKTGKIYIYMNFELHFLKKIVPASSSNLIINQFKMIS